MRLAAPACARDELVADGRQFAANPFNRRAVRALARLYLAGKPFLLSLLDKLCLVLLPQQVEVHVMFRLVFEYVVHFAFYAGCSLCQYAQKTFLRDVNALAMCN